MPAPITRALSGLALACTALATPALAVPDREPVLVRTRDLDLSTSTGQDMLRKRVEQAAHSLCDDAGLVDLRGMIQADRCRKAAIAGAAAQVGQAIASARTRATYAARPAGGRDVTE